MFDFRTMRSHVVKSDHVLLFTKTKGKRMNHFNLLEWLATYNVGYLFMGILIIGMAAISLVMLGVLMASTLRLFKKDTPKANTLDQKRLISLIDERIAYHTRGDEMERIIFGDKESVWNAPHYAALKGEVSEHLREAELESAIILIEKQRLKQLEIEELKLRLALVQRGDHHDQP
ncbi:MAG: hypothetical protein PHQ22_04515 [Sulfuricurvum sp.]|nr:hypothetical protein [Sulfuricurvum sp.]